MAQLEHWYLHVDLDAFFASVEQLDHPEYRGKPVIVGGKPEDRRSVVSTASYEARKYGVHSAMPTFQAYKLCPNGIFVHGRMERYAELSYQIMNIFRNYSPDVDQMSIDEAFIDITGTEKLFGPPLETAKKIKAEVMDKTGLTVSIGIAPTKYLAKIASGYQKPNGITFIQQGQKESFMLSLPLNKVWGLGPKSLELLHSKGIKTTRDIYEMPLENLTFMFGNNMGSYLYAVVRGNEKESFSREAKNHSISAESTYPYDLTDIYGIETELLELAHGVFFRLLKEGGYSRTAFVKIRYDDFSTCSAQETLERNIITLDTYFETIKRLFEKRYEKGRGIRLLGVGFENIEKEDKPYQQDLFENKDEKKQAVEKAILKLEKKHPEIKVRKARTFKSLLLIFALSLLPVKNYAQTNTNQKGAGTVLPDNLYTPATDNAELNSESSVNNNKLFDYEIEGYYQAELTTGIASSFGNNTAFAIAGVPPVFKQEVDITTSVIYDNHWYFEAAFADKFEKNTLTIGYKDSFINAKVSNRNIIFPAGYSAEVFGYSPKGGENQAPGISVNLISPSNKWAADFLLRYDMTESHSATFYGLNKVDDLYISPADFVYGLSFTFPSASENYLSQIKNIYIEDKQGKFTDSNGKKYKQLSITQYTVLNEKDTLLLSSNAGGKKKDNFIPTILITFNSADAPDLIIKSTGSYKDPDSFAGKIQKEIGNSYDLSQYSYKLTTEIENAKALIIQNSVGFSPYLNKNIYDLGTNSNADLLVVSKSSDSIIKEYQVCSWDDIYNSIFEDFFQENHTYAQAAKSNGICQQVPFGNVAPEIYFNLNTSSDYMILKRNYSSVKELSIGTKAAAGTVQVYKNGILEAGADYNPETGKVTLSSPITNTDKIYIIWQEDSKDYSNGSLTTAAGYKINFNELLSGDISFSAHWPVNAFLNTNHFSTQDTLQVGYAALTSGILYKNEWLTVSDKASIAITKENASNKLLVCSQENEVPSTYFLESSSGYSTKAAPTIKTDNNYISLTADNNSTVGNHIGIQDSNISGYAIPLTWDFSQKDSPWAAVDIKLSSGYLLKNSSHFELALKSSIPESELDNYDVYLQLGVNADSTYYGEDSDLIPAWKLNLEHTNSWQQVRIYLSDSERSKLISHSDARIIVVPSKANHTSGNGTIYIGPYEPYAQNIYTKSPEEIFTSVTTSIYNNDYYSSIINWVIPSTVKIENIENPYIYSVMNFSSADFSKYGSINLDFTSDNINSYKINLKSNKGTALSLELNNILNYINSSNSMHTLCIRFADNSILIDGNTIDSSDYELYLNKNFIPNTMEIAIPITKNGSFTIGNLYYQDTKFIGNAKNYASIDYEKAFNSFKLKAGANSLQSTGSFEEPDFNITSTGKVDFISSIADIKSDLTVNNYDVANAGHFIRASIPVKNLFTISEDYRFSPSDKSLSKKDGATLDLNSVKVPLKFDFETFAQDMSLSQNQTLKLNITSNNKIKDYGINLSLKGIAEQKIVNDSTYNKDNYFLGWKDISLLEFSYGYENAINRQTGYETLISSSIPLGNFNPSITYSLSSQYKNIQSVTYSDKEFLQLSLPFTISTNNFTFNISRTGNGYYENYKGLNYGDDSNELLNLQKQRQWFYTSIPVYELFSQNLKDEINANYSAKYETLYKRKLFNSIKDLYIPSSASFAIIRDIKNQDSVKDLYQYKAVITNTSINNFGSDSILHLFDWYKQEELISSITGIIKVPSDSPENTSYQLTAYLQALFMINDKATLTTAIDGSIETNYNWTTHGTAIYSRPSETSFVLNLAQFIVPRLKTIDFTITRKDILNIQIGTTNQQNKQSYTYQHNVDHKFLSYFSFSTGIGGTYTFTENQANNLAINLNLGIKAEF